MGGSEGARARFESLMIELILLLQAELDIQSAFNRYKDIQSGRGEVFIRQLDGALSLCVGIRKSHLFIRHLTVVCSFATFRTEFSTRLSPPASSSRPSWTSGRILKASAVGCSGQKAPELCSSISKNHSKAGRVPACRASWYCLTICPSPNALSARFAV